MRFLIPFFILVPALQAQVLITDFCGANTTADPSVIAECEGQVSSNVEPARSGFGLKKRDGFQTAVNMKAGATSLTSAFIFKNQSGVECVLGVDQAGNLEKSSNFSGATHLSTITAGARLYCQDNDGTAYCFTSSNDPPFSYDCTTYTLEQADGQSYPNGKFNLFIQDRHLVAGTTDFLNRLHISKSGDWDEFVGGLDEVESWTEDIGRNGDRITGLIYLNGRVVVFKEFSIGAFSPIDTQFNSAYYNISETIGISDPEAVAIHNGVAYLKASDNHFYAIDGNPGAIKRISGKIKTDIANLLSGKNRQIILTTKADFDGGNLTVSGPGAPMSSLVVPGSVMPSSVTHINTSSSDFGSGTATDVSTHTTDNQLTAAISFANAGGESEDETNWDITGTAPWINGTASPSWGVRSWGNGCSGATTVKTQIWNADATKKILEDSTAVSDGMDTDFSIDTSTLTNTSVILRITHDCGSPGSERGVMESFQFVRGSSVVYNISDGDGSGQISALIDVQEEGFSWTFVSQSFDSGFSTPTFGTFAVNLTTSADNTATFQVQSSSDSANWESLSSQTPGNVIAASVDRYLRYKISGELNCSTCTLASIQDVSLAVATTGQYETSCIEPGSDISAFGNLEAAGQKIGVVVLSFEDKVGADCDNLGSYSAVSTGTAITQSASAAYKVRVTFDLTSATETARLDSITVNWNEGSVASASSVEAWEDSIYIAVSSVTGSNNRVFRYIPGRDSIWPFELKTNQMLRYKDKLYMTSTTDGSLYQYSSQSYADAPTSDAGADITAVWRSKLFSGGDPFRESNFDRISILARDENGGDFTAKWRINGGDTATGSYTVDLSTGLGPVRNNYSIPVGQRGQFFDLEISDTSTEPFEVLGIKIDGKQLPWRVLP